MVFKVQKEDKFTMKKTRNKPKWLIVLENILVMVGCLILLGYFYINIAYEYNFSYQ